MYRFMIWICIVFCFGSIISPQESTNVLAAGVSQSNTPQYAVINEIVQGSVFDISINPDGKILAIATNTGIQLYAVPSFEYLGFFFEMPHANVFNLAWSPDGTMMALNREGRIQLWDFNAREMVHELNTPDNRIQPSLILGLKWSPDSNYLVSSEGFVWQASDGSLINQLDISGANIFEWSPDGGKLAAIYADSLKIWDWQNGMVMQELMLSSNARDIEWSNAGIALVTEDGVYLGNNIDNLTLIPESEGENISDGQWSPDGRKLATFTDFHDPQTIFIWDVASMERVQAIDVKDALVQKIFWLSDNVNLISYGIQDTVRLWDSNTAQEQAHLDNFKGSLFDITISPDGNYVAASTASDQIIVWQAIDGQLHLDLEGHGIQWSPDGKFLATISDNTAIVQDAMNGTQYVVLEGHDDLVKDIAWSPDSSRLVTTSSDFTARIWDVDTGKELFALALPIPSFSPSYDFISNITWSPDGLRLASASPTAAIEIWDANTGQHDLTISYALFNGPGYEFDPMWSPDGQYLAVFNPRCQEMEQSQCIDIWDVESGDKTTTLLIDRAFRLSAFQWSQDGQQVIIVGGEFWIIDVATGETLSVLGIPSDDFKYIAQSSDGSRLTTASSWRLVVWDRISDPALDN